MSKPVGRVYILTVRVTDDGIGDPYDDGDGEYVSVADIVDEIETVDTVGLVKTVEKIENETNGVRTQVKLPHRRKTK